MGSKNKILPKFLSSGFVAGLVLSNILDEEN
jgi:hypothetical protein